MILQDPERPATAQAAEWLGPVSSGCQARRSPLHALTDHPGSRLGAAEPPRMGLGRWAFMLPEEKNLTEEQTEKWEPGCLPMCLRPLGQLCSLELPGTETSVGCSRLPPDGDLETARKLPSTDIPLEGKLLPAKRVRISSEVGGDPESGNVTYQERVGPRTSGVF